MKRELKNLKDDEIEFRKCQSSPLYFYNNYIRDEKEPELTQVEFDHRIRLWEIARGGKMGDKPSVNNPFLYQVENYVPVEWSYQNKPTSSAYIFPGVKILRYTPHDIVEDVAKYLAVNPDDIRSGKRTQAIMRARQIATHFIHKKFPNISLGGIDLLIRGKKEHSTILHSLKVVRSDMKTSKLFKDMVDEVERKIDERRIKKDSKSSNKL